MIPIWLGKIVAKRVIKAIKYKIDLKKIDKYVNKPNELDIQLKFLQKTVNKQGKYIEELEKDVAILKRDSHSAQEYICCRKCGCKIAKTKIRKKEK
tara:strand:+ start:536 stop:823 length:288 start_codon:yes stop_codon:yes gene_type:complete